MKGMTMKSLFAAVALSCFVIMVHSAVPHCCKTSDCSTDYLVTKDDKCIVSCMNEKSTVLLDENGDILPDYVSSYNNSVLTLKEPSSIMCNVECPALGVSGKHLNCSVPCKHFNPTKDETEGETKDETEGETKDETEGALKHLWIILSIIVIIVIIIGFIVFKYRRTEPQDNAAPAENNPLNQQEL